MDENYININRDAWNKKTGIHLESEFYDNESFIENTNSLKQIELELLGDIRGKSVLHLQCHFGQDSISLAKLGAKVTAVDLSDKAIDAANILAKKTNAEVDFICCNVYDLPKHLSKKFDIMFASYGVIGWLPDLKKWAEVVAHFLKPDGEFIFVEFHPFIWMYDDDFDTVAYRYFNSGEIVEDVKGTYANRDAKIEYKTICWNHSTSEVLNSLIKAGINIEQFNEYDYSPYNCFKHTLQIGTDKFIIKHLGNKIPMTFAIRGRKVQTI